MPTTLSLFQFFLVKSFLIAFLAIFCLRSLSIKIGLVDNPGGRKKHKSSVPLIGGWAVFLGFSMTLAHEISSTVPFFVFWLSCSLLIVISGVDDIYSLRAGHRFILHFFLMTLICVFGDTFISQLGNVFGTGVVFLGWGSILFTGVSSVGIINAVNMMDGVDGLTACVSLVELSLLLYLAMLGDFNLESMVIATFMGAILGFLVFNFPAKLTEQHKVFLGDTGSMLIGLLLVWLCIRLTQNAAHAYPPVLMLWIVALPLMDALHLMINRKARGVSPFKADRRHIHHVLLRLHYSNKQILCILTTMSLGIGLLGIGLYRLGLPDVWLFCGMLMMFLFYSYLSYVLKKRITQRPSYQPLTLDLIDCFSLHATEKSSTLRSSTHG